MTMLIEKMQEFNSEHSISNYIFIYNYFKNIVSQNVAQVRLDSKHHF